MNEAVRKESISVALLPREVSGKEACIERASEYLNRIPRLEQNIKRKLFLQESLRELATRTTGDPFSRPSGGEDQRSAAVVRYIDLEKEIDRDIDHLVDLRKEVTAVLAAMEDDRLSRLLEDRYLRGLLVKQAAANAEYSVRHAQRRLREGLLKLDRILRRDRPMQGYVRP